ncbi:7311_t:CDS:2 [Diversispora eburnea]|uniref:7311_t:CDS:1 n=1 Tax=Diversispora eburnea TaxID=1213867 RepID=A0A9N9AGD4_9GLOM|nr:7311_t:CDS:2 [Diversispora eburnea]
MSVASVAPSVSSSPPRPQIYTCLACQVTFDVAESQRNHYVTDWHRYNLKRKIAELPPVTHNAFEQKALAQQALNQNAVEKASFSAECSACGKTYYSENAYANHLHSNKHKIAEIKATQEGKLQKKITINLKNKENLQEIEQLSIEEIIEKKIASSIKLDETDCLFCIQKSESFDDNMRHMTKVHSFFIPEIEYLVDLHGLIQYLGEKISVGNVCIYCNGRGKELKSLEAVRKHMIDKGHCKIAYDTDEDIMEIVDFYGFSTACLSEDSEGWIHLDDDEWENIKENDDSSSGSIADKHVIPKNELVYDETELILPSGARVGHRSLQRYYKQSLRPLEEHDSVIINRLITQYGESFGYTRNSGGLLIAKSAQAKHSRNSILDKSCQLEFDTRVGIKANKLQRHLRKQIL